MEVAAREQVLAIYPDAVILHDEWNKLRDKEQGTSYNYILVYNMSYSMKQRVLNDIISIKIPYHYESGLKNEMISDWCESPEQCWESAWKRILRKTLDKFNE